MIPMNKYESKYPSRHKPGTYITVGQWLGELMCERKALRETKELPRAFWLKIHDDKVLNQEWSRYLKTQTQQAYKLLKKFGEKQVVEAVKAKSTLYSLLPKWVVEYISNFKIVEIVKKEEEPQIKLKKNPTHRTQSFRKKGLIDLLSEEDE